MSVYLRAGVALFRVSCKRCFVFRIFNFQSLHVEFVANCVVLSVRRLRNAFLEAVCFGCVVKWCIGKEAIVWMSGGMDIFEFSDGSRTDWGSIGVDYRMV